MHYSLMEDNHKPLIEHQRSWNPNVTEVIKKEILKFLKVDIINPISDSKWVRVVQVVLKKQRWRWWKMRTMSWFLLEQTRDGECTLSIGSWTRPTISGLGKTDPRPKTYTEWPRPIPNPISDVGLPKVDMKIKLTRTELYPTRNFQQKYLFCMTRSLPNQWTQACLEFNLNKISADSNQTGPKCCLIWNMT